MLLTDYQKVDVILNKYQKEINKINIIRKLQNKKLLFNNSDIYIDLIYINNNAHLYNLYNIFLSKINNELNIRFDNIFCDFIQLQNDYKYIYNMIKNLPYIINLYYFVYFYY